MVDEIVAGVDSSSAMLVDRLGLPPMVVAYLTIEMLCILFYMFSLFFSCSLNVFFFSRKNEQRQELV